MTTDNYSELFTIVKTDMESLEDFVSENNELEILENKLYSALVKL